MYKVFLFKFKLYQTPSHILNYNLTSIKLKKYIYNMWHHTKAYQQLKLKLKPNKIKTNKVYKQLF